jgi:transglutaminase/protease-like cytokinesis protein 3
LCSYAGLHCVVIKGYSKSAGYQPGVRFEDNRFRNSWNAVYVAGAWRFVQCNWGARHLVNAKEVPKPGSKSKSDSLRYYIFITICQLNNYFKRKNLQN